MLADPWAKSRASIGLLSSQINTWRAGRGDAADYNDPIALADGRALAREAQAESPSGEARA